MKRCIIITDVGLNSEEVYERWVIPCTQKNLDKKLRGIFPDITDRQIDQFKSWERVEVEWENPQVSEHVMTFIELGDLCKAKQFAA